MVAGTVSLDGEPVRAAVGGAVGAADGDWLGMVGPKVGVCVGFMRTNLVWAVAPVVPVAPGAWHSPQLSGQPSANSGSRSHKKSLLANSSHVKVCIVSRSVSPEVAPSVQATVAVTVFVLAVGDPVLILALALVVAVLDNDVVAAFDNGVAAVLDNDDVVAVLDNEVVCVS